VRLRRAGIWGAAVACLLAIGTGAVLGAGDHLAWNAAAIDAGLRLYARVLDLAQGASLGLILPVIAMSISFHAGTRVMRRTARRAEARAVAAARPSMVRSAILFGLTAIMTLLYAATQSLP
jgi:hypothetical protein